VHGLYERADVRDAVVARWGEQVAPGGVVSRSEVARHAFASPEERAWLEAFIWPRVRAAVDEWRAAESARVPPPPALIVEVPLLFESGGEAAYDATIAVVVDEDVRAARAAARGHAAVDERTARQLTQAEKAARADHVVRNDADIAALESALSAVLAKLTRS
jgi:dephospho-CoA kinase